MVEKHFVNIGWVWVQWWEGSGEAHTSFPERHVGAGHLESFPYERRAYYKPSGASVCSSEEGLVPSTQCSVGGRWDSLSSGCLRHKRSSHRGGASLPGPPLLRTREPLTSLRSSQSAPPAPSASLKQPGFLEFPSTTWSLARDVEILLQAARKAPRLRLGRGSEGSSGLATWPSIRVLFSDVPVSSPRSSGRAAKGIRASGGCEVIASTYHHVDALFGELHEMLWFNGTVVHPKPSEDAGIHRLRSRVLMWQIPAQGFLRVVLRAKEGSELMARGDLTALADRLTGPFPIVLVRTRGTGRRMTSTVGRQQNLSWNPGLSGDRATGLSQG